MPATHYGRVETLFVAVGQQHWDVFDPSQDSGHRLHAAAKFENTRLGRKGDPGEVGVPHRVLARVEGPAYPFTR
ncbi:MAG: hypothetical protein HS126_31080 [Anaerolineales bacterium]|nr:hypothetical protein [Anaerolineales bacterium]